MQKAHALAAKINARYPLHSDKKIIKIVNAEIKKLNGNLGKTEKLKHFRIVSNDVLSMNNFKSAVERRIFVQKECSDLIESMYNEFEVK
jgi:long-subunit acyl-CoA synthetase (AMP-forming)